MNTTVDRVKVGFATLAQPTFDVGWSQDMMKRSIRILKKLGVEVVSLDRPLMSEAEAWELRRQFEKQQIDVLLVQSGAFAWGGLVMILAGEGQIPCILWATPEPPFDGGPIRSNSLCAVIMNNSNLRKAGSSPGFLFGAPEQVEAELGSLVKAARAAARLKRSKIGIVGHRVPGFYSSGFNEIRLQASLGPQAHHLDLSTVLSRMRRVSEDMVNQVVESDLPVISGMIAGKEDGLRGSVRAYLALKELAREHSLDALAVKCWPEFPTENGMSVCLSLSLLNDSGIPTACEADVYGATTMLVLLELTSEPMFFNDLIQVDEETNQALFWHCGAAPRKLRSPSSLCEVRTHAMRGTAATIDFSLKPGRVTIARISEDGPGWKILAVAGEAVETPLLLRGNTLSVRMDNRVKALVRTILEEGIEHHFVLAYGDVTKEIQWLSKLMNIRNIEVATPNVDKKVAK
ncbi:MAG: hypothetical protein QME79_02285 [Bacillota bacterium]|nr:hypothetical protein [Bacillota bacterium]